MALINHVDRRPLARPVIISIATILTVAASSYVLQHVMVAEPSVQTIVQK